MGAMIRRPLAVLAVLALLGACGSESASGPTTTVDATPTTPCDEPADQMDAAYVEGGDSLQALDLYLPDDAGCGPVPLVVWVHGGGWSIGDKRFSIEDKLALWNEAGWAVASVNYRLTDADLPEADRVMAPAHNQDVAAAVGWLVDNASDLGLDPERVALLGHSAGAGIVAALAADPAYLDAVGLSPTDVDCVAPLDTEAFSVEAAATTGPQLAAIYEAAFGTDPARWADLSPLTHVGDAPVPDLFLVTRGTPARRQVVATFAEAVEAADGDVTIVDLPGFTHEDVNKRIGTAADAELTPALQTFLTTCLAR